MLTGMSAGKTEEQVISPEYTHKVVSENWCEIVGLRR